MSQEIFIFAIRLTRATLTPKWYFPEMLEQLYSIGVGSLALIALTGILAGQGFALALSQTLADFGSKDYLGHLVAIAIIREMGPILAGLMFAARVSAGITAELGAMKSSNQIDAMTAFGIDPLKKLAVPRLVALVIMVPALTILCDVIAIFGGYIIAKFIANVSGSIYWTAVRFQLSFGNMSIGLLKPLAFSLVIAFISCYKGFASEGGTKGVGRSTTESVVLSAITILVVNFFITKVVGAALKGYM